MRQLNVNVFFSEQRLACVYSVYIGGLLDVIKLVFLTENQY